MHAYPSDKAHQMEMSGKYAHAPNSFFVSFLVHTGRKREQLFPGHLLLSPEPLCPFGVRFFWGGIGSSSPFFSFPRAAPYSSKQLFLLPPLLVFPSPPAVRPTEPCRAEWGVQKKFLLSNSVPPFLPQTVPLPFSSSFVQRRLLRSSTPFPSSWKS